jgi:hypothetical protein
MKSDIIIDIINSIYGAGTRLKGATMRIKGREETHPYLMRCPVDIWERLLKVSTILHKPYQRIIIEGVIKEVLREERELGINLDREAEK